MKIRLEGLPADLDTATAAIAAVLPVVEISADYPNRRPSALFRRYLTLRPGLARRGPGGEAGPTTVRLDTDPPPPPHRPELPANRPQLPPGR